MCVESSVLYDCHARVWYKRELREVQKWMDKCYTYVWSDRNGQPLRHMSERRVNIVDVRERLGVKSVAWKVDKRVLERIGHVLRMGNKRLTKAMVLRWYEGLEGWSKMIGRKNAVLYWKRMLREAGIDVTYVERLVSDRKGWKERVEEWIICPSGSAKKGKQYEWTRRKSSWREI